MNVTKVDQKKGKIIELLLSRTDEPYALPIAKKLLVQSTEEYNMCCEIRRKFAGGHGSVGWRQASLFEWDCKKTAQPDLVGDELVPLRIYICTKQFHVPVSDLCSSKQRFSPCPGVKILLRARGPLFVFSKAYGPSDSVSPPPSSRRLWSLKTTPGPGVVVAVLSLAEPHRLRAGNDNDDNNNVAMSPLEGRSKRGYLLAVIGCFSQLEPSAAPVSAAAVLVAVAAAAPTLALVAASQLPLQTTTTVAGAAVNVVTRGLWRPWALLLWPDCAVALCPAVVALLAPVAYFEFWPCDRSFRRSNRDAPAPVWWKP